MQSQSPEHTRFAVHLDTGEVLQFQVSGPVDVIQAYVMIALKNPDEVIEVFDLYQTTSLIPVRKVVHVDFGRS
jgi:hypothetical protein